MNPDIKKLAPLLTADNIQRAVQQNAITPQDLTGNQKAFTVPPAPTPTAGAPIDAYSSLAVETKKANDEALAAQSTGRADLEATLQQLMEIPSQRATLEQGAGITEKQTAYNEYTNQLESEQRTLKKQQDAIYNNPMLTREQAQQQFGEIQRQSLSKQADIATLQSISSRDLISAQNIIDKKIQNILEPLQMKYDFQKMFYQENREDLTKAQDRQFQIKLAESENTIAQNKTTLDTIKELFTTAAQNDAPQEVLNGILKAQTAGDLVTAQRLAGQYLVNPLDRQIKAQQLYNLQLTGRKQAMDLRGTSESGAPSTLIGLSRARGDIQMINELSGNKAITSAVGPSILSRSSGTAGGAVGRFLTGATGGAVAGGIAGAPFAGVGVIPGAITGALVGGTALALQGSKNKLTGQQQDFIAGVEQLRSNLNLNTLIQAKERGATFGALSDNELQVLANAATKMGSYAIKNKNGQVIGYNASEVGFKRELDKINYYAKLDYILKGGSPEDIGAIEQPDGTLWIKNSDGTLSQLK